MVQPGQGEGIPGRAAEQVADLLALKGDAVDNIPGAPGIGTGREGPHRAVRIGGSGAGTRGGSGAEGLPRGPPEPRRQVRQSKRLATISTDVPVPFSPESVKAQPVDAALLKALYTELEFHSLLKELGPGEDTRVRDYRVFESAEELKAWLEAAAGAPVAVAPSKSAEGEFALDTVGLAWRVGEARAVTAEYCRTQRVARGRRGGEGGVRRESASAGAGPAGH